MFLTSSIIYIYQPLRHNVTSVLDDCMTETLHESMWHEGSDIVLIRCIHMYVAAGGSNAYVHTYKQLEKQPNQAKD